LKHQIPNPKPEIRNKFEIRKSKSETAMARGEGGEMAEADRDGEKRYDLEERTFEFARGVRRFVRMLPRTVSNYEDVKQVVRASGSVGANYIEANESLGKRDFALRMKVARKEAKESRYWLRLLDTGDSPEINQARDELIQESVELMNILAAILRKSQ
jgi:four helix bundle protein